LLLAYFNSVLNPFTEIVPLLLSPTPESAKDPPLYDADNAVKLGAVVMTENDVVQTAHPMLL
jgi:hypothetical protein